MLREVSDYSLEGPLTPESIVNGVNIAVSGGGYSEVEESNGIVECFHTKNEAGVLREMVHVFHKACNELDRKVQRAAAGSSLRSEAEYEATVLRKFGMSLRSWEYISKVERKMLSKDLHRVMNVFEGVYDTIVEGVRGLFCCCGPKVNHALDAHEQDPLASWRLRHEKVLAGGAEGSCWDLDELIMLGDALTRAYRELMTIRGTKKQIESFQKVIEARWKTEMKRLQKIGPSIRDFAKEMGLNPRGFFMKTNLVDVGNTQQEPIASLTAPAKTQEAPQTTSMAAQPAENDVAKETHNGNSPKEETAVIAGSQDGEKVEVVAMKVDQLVRTENSGAIAVSDESKRENVDPVESKIKILHALPKSIQAMLRPQDAVPVQDESKLSTTTTTPPGIASVSVIPDAVQAQVQPQDLVITTISSEIQNASLRVVKDEQKQEVAAEQVRVRAQQTPPVVSQDESKKISACFCELAGCLELGGERSEILAKSFSSVFGTEWNSINQKLIVDLYVHARSYLGGRRSRAIVATAKKVAQFLQESLEEEMEQIRNDALLYARLRPFLDEQGVLQPLATRR